MDAVVGAALDQGVTYFDTAETYNQGASEASLGAALKGRRNRALIGSKVSPNHTAPARLRASCEASLRRLQTDHLDLYLLHWPINAASLRHYTNDAAILAQPPDTAEAFATLAALQREGKVRHIGVSNFGVRQLQAARATGVPIAVNELPYNLLMRGIEPRILPYCREAGIGVIGYMTLMQGVLSKAVRTFDELPPIRTRTRHFAGTRPGSRHGEPGIEAQTATALAAISRIAGVAGVPVGELALAWALANPAITCVLAGSRNAEQLTGNLRAATRRLTPEQVQDLNDATAEVLALLGPYADYYQGVGDQRTE